MDTREFIGKAVDEFEASRVLAYFFDRAEKKLSYRVISSIINSNKIDRLLVKVLKETTVNPDTKSAIDNNVLNLVCEIRKSENYSEVIKILLDRGANPNIPNGRTKEYPLHLAGRISAKAVVYLLDAGADPKVKNRRKQTPAQGLSKEKNYSAYTILKAAETGDKKKIEQLKDIILEKGKILRNT